MQLSHALPVMSATFDEPNLVVSSGLVPAVGLAQQVGIAELADDLVTVPGPAGANAGAKVMSLVAGMATGADSISDLQVLRHAAMGRVFTQVKAPSTIGTFLRGFTFGHVRQLDAVASRTLVGLVQATPLLPGIESGCVIDIDDTVKPVFGAGKQGSEFGYTRVRGLNAQLATISTDAAAPVIAATRLRRGARNSAAGGVRMLRDTIATARRCGATGPILVRSDSAYCTTAIVAAISKAGARFSVGIALNAAVRRAIAAIDETAWTRIDYPQAIVDPETGELVSAAEVAEIGHTAFISKPKAQQVTARLIVRRIPELNKAKLAGQDPLFPLYRYHAIFTDNPAPLIAAEAQHRGHAVVEQVIADLKNSALAHLPSGRFSANAAWLVAAAIAFNLTRALGVTAAGRFTKATTATIRARIINTPARVSRSARRIRLHLPSNWLWATSWLRAWNHTMTPATV
ncbi:MAG: IS1380 family transposase [Candidatus Nanopelagicales bacterium]